GLDGPTDDLGGPFVRRACGDVSACRRTIHLLARGVFAPVGISVRLDAVSGHPDWYDCRGCSWFRALPGSIVSLHFADNVGCRADRFGLKASHKPVDAATRRRFDDRASDVFKYSGRTPG